MQHKYYSHPKWDCQRVHLGSLKENEVRAGGCRSPASSGRSLTGEGSCKRLKGLRCRPTGRDRAVTAPPPEEGFGGRSTSRAPKRQTPALPPRAPAAAYVGR